jgi:hypothetical protein
MRSSTTSTRLATCAALLTGAAMWPAAPALAEDSVAEGSVADAPPAPIAEEAPPPAIVLRYVPANYAWDVGIHASYGQRVQFQGEPPWLGIGARFGWGKMIGEHRVGLGFAFSAEGEPAVKWSNIFTPSFQWDYVTAKGFMVGANVGPALLVNVELSGGYGYDTTLDGAPELAVRLGWSQRFSLIAKRFYVAVEPKLRIVDGKPEFVGGIVLGSGKGY